MSTTPRSPGGRAGSREPSPPPPPASRSRTVTPAPPAMTTAGRWCWPSISRRSGRVRVPTSCCAHTSHFCDPSEDCFGRGVWAGAEVVQCEMAPPATRDTGRAMLQAALPHAWRLQTIRGCANALLGAALLPDAGDVTAYLADRLVAADGGSADRGGRWFEPILTYDLGRMPQALFRAARRLRDARYHEVAEATLAFLLQVQTAAGVFAPLGSKGWYARGGERATGDTQYLEAGALAEACIDAYAVTHHAGYIDLARWAFDWYLGGNMLRIPLHDPATGRFFDALTPGRPNLNCGAESLLSYLLAYTALRGVEGLAIWRRGAASPSLRAGVRG